MYKAILFDLDGTISDSGIGIKTTAIETLDRLSIKHKDYQDLNYFVGPPLRECFRLSDVDEDRIEEAVNIYREIYNKTGIFNQKLFPGIRDLLIRLKQEGFHNYICTSKGEKLAKKVINNLNLDDLFIKVCGTIEEKSIPKSVTIERILKNINSPYKAIMVGDTYMDIEAANTNNIKSIYVKYGYGDDNIAIKYNPTYLADDVIDIYDCIKDFYKDENN